MNRPCRSWMRSALSKVGAKGTSVAIDCQIADGTPGSSVEGEAEEVVASVVADDPEGADGVLGGMAIEDKFAAPRTCGYQRVFGSVSADNLSEAVSQMIAPQRGGMMASRNMRCHTVCEVPLSMTDGLAGLVAPEDAKLFSESGRSGSIGGVAPGALA